ncbi:lysylphosphatidylglycerol synthase transmembrane domain-containing protein [Ruminococcus sp. Marseille-P6503]|uniref:lysylphosphatidylglycerol synthase transmembrane domain-containing protein n=1 Tax=Ruminococcus sp. Marseille-P6503 TaxID=2364796 RepID=UPI001FAA9FBE|nr:lysylphosphatidylglycerol synthase transmembrane domain-containing protein [Ruminococcus sp. Marseille-P6503]
MKKTLSYAFNVLFIAVIGYLTLRLLFKDTDIESILADLHRADKLWLAAGALFVFFFVSGESVIIKYMLTLFGSGVPFYRCLKYSFIGFFYSCITPSSSGGQPAQVFYMKKDGIKIGYSSLIMLVVTVAYKAVLVIFGVAFFLFKYGFVVRHTGGWLWLLAVGFILNIAYIAGLVFIFFRPFWAKAAGIRIAGFLCRIHILKQKNLNRYTDKIERICNNYMNGAEYIKGNARAVVNIFIITAVQRLFLLAVTYVVYKSYGLSGTGFTEIVAIQTMIAIAVEMLPLPGAAGITEACFIVMFNDIFTNEYVRSGMLLSRGLSFYLLLVMSAAVTFAAHLICMRKSAAE